jgi:hypothetical protein
MTKDKPVVIGQVAIDIAVMANKLNSIESDVSDIKQKLDAHYVTNDQFEPVKKIVYGMVSLILLAVVGALVALVINK